MKLARVVAGPHESGLAIGARHRLEVQDEFGERLFRFSVNVVVTCPVSGFGVTVL